MRVLILGAGAVGLALAACLSKIVSVTAVTRSPHAARISKEGLELFGIWGEGTYQVDCRSHVSPEERFDFVLVTSKSGDTRDLCEQNQPSFCGAIAVSFQNGVGNEDVLSHYAEKVIGGVIMTGFVRTGERGDRVIASAGPVKIGLYPAGHDPCVDTLRDLLIHAGIPVLVSLRIQDDIWAKNLVNATVSSLCAITGVTCGRLPVDEVMPIIQGIAKETFSVTAAIGVRLPWTGDEEFCGYIRDVVIPSMSGHPASMLQDLTAGKITEIDFINGAVVRYGKSLGIPTPYNTCITNLVHGLEKTVPCGGPPGGTDWNKNC